MKASELSKDKAFQVWQFIKPESQMSRYLFGCNEHSKALSDCIDVDGFIDDFRPVRTFNGKPVLAGNEVGNESWVVNCSLAIRPITAEKRIKELNSKVNLTYSDFLQYAPNFTPIPRFVSEARDDLKRNSANWARLGELLTDPLSKKVLADVMAFRTSANLANMVDHSFNPKGQYFDEVCHFSKDEVFVDCGGFDGDTTQLFLNHCPKYKRVWIFEPSPLNMASAKKRLATNREIVFVPKGVSDTTGSVVFNSNAGSASVASDDGDMVIELATIDEVVSEPVSFIKMDLEGWELKALHGARFHILNDHPKLAIAVYHEASHFWKIPELILSMRSDYRVFLRHYTEGWTETIMYFIPVAQVG